MAMVVITLIDEQDDIVNTAVHFDPGVSKNAEATPAQMLACEMLEAIAYHERRSIKVNDGPEHYLQ